MEGITPLNRLVAGIAIILLGLLAYLPALNNPFIADDYAFLHYVQPLENGWSHLADIPLGLRRLTSSLFFYLCFSLFGLQAAPYYGANLLLHLANTALVWLLVRELVGDRRIAFVAALLFVTYERHHEPMLWITAHHELLLCLGVLATVIFFLRFRRSGHRSYYWLALALFAFSAVSKESFVVLAPVLILLDLCALGSGAGRQWFVHIPFWVVSGAYLVGMVMVQHSNPFYATYYGITPHFFVVYLRSVNRLSLFVYVFLFLAWLAYRRAERSERFPQVVREKPFQFLLAWLVVTPIPYCFLLYLDHIPSRQTYIPSVATAGLVAILSVRAWEQLANRRARLIGVTVLVLCLAGNIAYIWRKDAQFLERAAPTEQLIEVLNRHAPTLTPLTQVVLYDFPYNPIIAQAAAQFFTPVAPEQLTFRNSGEGSLQPTESYVLRWKEGTMTIDFPDAPP